MLYVLLCDHSPEVCPMSNAKTREAMLRTTPEVPDVAKKNGVKFVAGPYVNREHTMVIVVETDRSESLDAFILDSGLEQWNRIHVLPSKTLEDGIKDIERATPIF